MPNGKEEYAIGTITSDYYFVGLEQNLPHRRKVKWNTDLIYREQFSEALRRSLSVGGAVCDEGQSVKGAIIALEDDQKLRRAISMVNGISFYRYKISFKLVRN